MKEESTRQRKVAKLIQQELGTFFQRNAGSYAKGALITVTVVRISPDLGAARVYLSIFGSSDAKAALKAIKADSVEIRRHLAAQVRHQLRIVPELSFIIDDSLDHAARIDELLRGG